MPKSSSDDDMESENEPINVEPVTVLYFGAGRGPLITRALNAAKKVGIPVQVIALDKNPNAIITLRSMIYD